jgi:hypothetical protein
METHQFRASVQYGDWKGTSAANDSDMTGPRDWLKKQGHMKDGEVLLGVRFFAHGNHAARKDPVQAEFLLVQLGDHDNVKAMIEAASGPIEVRSVKTDMSFVDFFGLFKRFNVAFSAYGMLDEREYRILPID